MVRLLSIKVTLSMDEVEKHHEPCAREAIMPW